MTVHVGSHFGSPNWGPRPSEQGNQIHLSNTGSLLRQELSAKVAAGTLPPRMLTCSVLADSLRLADATEAAGGEFCRRVILRPSRHAEHVGETGGLSSGDGALLNH